MYKKLIVSVLISPFLIAWDNNKDSVEKIFTEIYDTRFWGVHESASGVGSIRAFTIKLRQQLATVFKKYHIKKINDAPCGDFNWMKAMKLRRIKYRGFDIVKRLIDKNNALYKKTNIRFYHANLIETVLPQADAIFCRDTLQHLTLEDAVKVLQNFKKSNSTYLLATTYPRTEKVNQKISTREWGLINLCLPPFNFPKPIELINEGCIEVSPDFGELKDKSIGIWLLKDINI